MARDDASKNGIQVIARAARILRALREAQTGMSLGQIADIVGLPRSTVQRIVGALQEERLVIASLQGGGLRIGPEMQSFANAARYNIVESCRLLLTELSQETGETSDLSVLRGAGMIFLDQVPGTHRLRTVSSVGEVFPLTTTANGKVCLALLPPERAQALARAEWDRRGMSVDPEAFEVELAEVRETGLAYDRNDHTEGISAIGIGFHDWSGDLHAISVPVPSSRFCAIEKRVRNAILKTRAHVTKLMER
ncbi:IclR family transcriptional regulator [Thioclava sp. BHET1]|uniref:IclR family transcriptional regulator n=1 Tax=Thioclava dalianensis TaxID=1185766 RepID=A0A074T8Y1_9RHOB|nr:IclR family transcriptional regulator [Thioclava dalianensis]KEP68174.1 IclR family transcriptional regulator [Thioclava dalianensis]TMV91813.1 IclR family transcriptional regulator [Thioclava sp. BHET1]SFN86048.1 transcriptional regulator, IclR family [Thioclava dalianensis]